jgi:hypothetical protein
MFSLITTAKMNDVDPQVWLADGNHPLSTAGGSD